MCVVLSYLIFCFFFACAASLTPLDDQAFKDHEIVDVFHRPGECDVTANVDFGLLKEVLSDLGRPFVLSVCVRR